MVRKTEIRRTIKYHNVAILVLLAVGMALTIYILLRTTPGTTSSEPGEFDISYAWTPRLEKAMDLLREVSVVIEHESANLYLVKRASGDYGVVYKLNDNRNSALALAEEHNKLLQSTELGPAEAIKNDEYYHLYNVDYGIEPDIEVQKSNYQKLSEILGPGITRGLVIESSSDGYRITYKVLADERSSMDVARGHSKLLESKGITATIVMDSRSHMVYGESSYLNDLLEKESLYNVSYGLGPNLEPQKKNYLKIAQMLGEDVARNLVIQETPYGNFLLVYTRRKDEQSTRSIARKHSKLLRKKRLSAAIIRENKSNTIVYPESYVDEGFVKLEAKIEREKTEEKPAPDTLLSLQQQIQNYISELKRLGKLAPNDKVACSVYDFTTGEKLVSIKEDESLQCASMVKPLVALAFFNEVDRGKLIYGRKSKAKMESMIQMGGNAQTNWLMRHVGGPEKVQEILDTHYSKIFSDTEVKEFIPRGGETYLNKASVHDYSRFLYAMWNGQLTHSRELRRLMVMPNNDRVYRGVKVIPKGTLVYDKTGSTSYLIGNMAILVAKGRNGKRFPYTLICVIEKHKKAPNYTVWKKKAEKIIREVSNKVYIVMKKRHNLI